VDDPARVALPDTCPALVSCELAERVHVRLRENQQESAGRNPDPLETLWRNLIVCGHCGRPVGTMCHPWGRRYYCRARMNRNGASPNPCAGRSGGIPVRRRLEDQRPQQCPFCIHRVTGIRNSKGIYNAPSWCISTTAVCPNCHTPSSGR
jgi:hypothetical protein